MALTYKDYADRQYKQIPTNKLKDGDVFICRTASYHNALDSRDFAVARMRGGRAEVCGKFKLEFFAKTFACSI